MKKVLVLLLAVFASFQLAQAAYTNDDLIIETKDGNTVAYHLSTRPVVTFELTDLVLTSTDVKVQYPVTDVKELRFADGTTAINETKVGDITFSVSGDMISANGLENGSNLEVYSIDGKEIAKASVDATGKAQVNISDLGQGVYVVKAGKKSYKILK